VSLRSPGSDVEAANPKALVGAGHIKGSGTSQAAAVVSGLSALVLAQHPTWTPDQVKHALTSTASPLAAGARTEQGAGRARLAAALTAAPGPASWQVPTATGLGSLEGSRGSGHVEVVCPDAASATVVAGELDAVCEAWDGSKWTGSKWTGSKWTGSKWTGSNWTGSKWTGSKWTGSKWTGSTWTGADLATGDITHGDDFLTVFWGQNPKAGLIVPGETSDAA
jgi:serine protease AprX